MNKKLTSKTARKRSFWHNLKPGTALLLLPIAGAIFVVYYILSNNYTGLVASIGTSRLITPNWEVADKAFADNIPTYERKYAYYRVKENQTLADIAVHFSVPESRLLALNPGKIATGISIKIPPLQTPLTPLTTNTNNLAQLKITTEEGVLRIKNDFQLPQVRTTWPKLVEFLKPYDAISQPTPGNYRVEKAVLLEENIRIDILAPAVKTIELRSDPNQNITCLCLEDASLLVKGVTIRSYQTLDGTVDTDFTDGRAFVRALKSSRMDIISSDLSYLGNELQNTSPGKAQKDPLQVNGAAYGVSWRIPKASLGIELVTGWVERSRFYKNYFGSYSFGASGMVWKGNTYTQNDVYGLDPHDDSNNALVENNLFERNGSHGFIVSKRCNYNIIRGNRSINNGLHGYMLHVSSAYNLVENNFSSGNVDNFAIYASNNNTVRGNTSINAKGSHIRINEGSVNTYVMNNRLSGGAKAIFIYGAAGNTYITGNSVAGTKDVLSTDQAGHTVFARNTIDGLRYRIGAADRVIFGTNDVKTEES